MFGWVSSLFGRKRQKVAVSAASVRTRPIVRARYDAAQTNDDNRRHWAAADSLSAKQANSFEVRQRLRSRARYEVANNSYARGIVNTLANHVIGTGPRLQMQTDRPEVNRAIEMAFGRWSHTVRLADKLRTMIVAEVQDGEGFAKFTTNSKLPTSVKLDIKPVEAEQVTTPQLWLFDPRKVDGITFDSEGNPETYQILREHPGDSAFYETKPENVPAEDVLHLFRVDRPGQVRGVPEIMPALGLFASLRRYTEAVLAAAETAADFAAVMYSTSSAAGDQDEVEPFAAIELEKRAMLTLPDGWQLGQVKAEQPTTTYQMFKRELIAEIGRCLNMPYNIAAGDSSSYNYSSGRLDHQVYYADIEIRRQRVEIEALDRILPAWFDEAAIVPGALPDGMGLLNDLPHEWQWDAPAHIDEEKEAKAQKIRLQTGMTSFQTEFSREGKADWEMEQERQSQALGMTLVEYRKRLADSLFPPTPEPAEPTEESNEDADDVPTPPRKHVPQKQVQKSAA